MTYTPLTYTPIPSLAPIHNTVRILGSNKITVLGLDEVGHRQGPLYAYAIGVIVPAGLMIVCFFIWMFSLYCVQLCFRGKCSKDLALVFFVLSGTFSIAAWVAALIANGNTTNGLNEMLLGVEAVQGLADAIIEISNNATQIANQSLALANSLSVYCANNRTNVPSQQLISGLESAIKAANGNSGVISQLTTINDDFNTYKTEVVQYLSWRYTGSMIVFIVTIVVLFFFLLTTALRVMTSTPQACRHCVRFSSRGTSCLVFVFGILLLLIIWIFLALIHVIVTVGADLCLPNVNTNVNILIAQLSQSWPNETDPCSYPSFANSQDGVLCFYQDCAGPNFLENLVSPIFFNSNLSVSQALQFEQALGNATLANPYMCNATIYEFFDKVDGILLLVDVAIEALSCPIVNPVYAFFIYSGFCNGLVGGLVFTYISVICASVFMMLCICLFRIFEFHRYEDGVLPEAFYLEEDMNGNKVIINPGYSGPEGDGHDMEEPIKHPDMSEI